jgi:site-specific DNA-methyltransferase (adenine-specific)
MIKLLHGDCLELMGDIPDGSIDMILCDLPYGTTACKWDTVIPFEPLWAHYKRVIKKNGAAVLFGSQPFTSALVMSNLKMFKYQFVWNKLRPSNPMLAKIQCLKVHEDILIFANGKTVYYPQGLEDTNGKQMGGRKPSKTELGFGKSAKNDYKQKYTNYPKSILEFGNHNNKNVHPTQKPVALLEYLVKTYTNEGELVLDNCMGSGSTGVAAKNLNRRFIGIEKDENYYNIAVKRINEI